MDSVLESTRRKEEEVKKQTSEQLDLFRRQQEEADKAVIDGGGEVNEGEDVKGRDEEEKWAVNRGKRKRVEDKKGLKRVKLRKASLSAHDREGFDTGPKSPPPATHIIKSQSKVNTSSTTLVPAPTLQSEAVNPPRPAPKPNQIAPPGLGLAGYSSDDED